MILSLSVAWAVAQDLPAVDGQAWSPPIDSHTTLWTESSAVRDEGFADVAAWTSYGYRPLRALDRTGDREVLLSDLWTTDIVGSVHWGRFRAGADLPLVFLGAGLGPTAAGIGDLAVDVKANVLDGATGPVGAALGGRLQLPTSSLALPVGLGGTGGELYGVLDTKQGPFAVALQAGTRSIPRAEWGSTVFDDHFFGRVAGTYEASAILGASAELGVATNWSPRTNPGGTAAELLGGGWWQVDPMWRVRAGLGAGLGVAPGTAGFRALASVAYTPPERPDRDLDGLADREDRCPMVAEDVDGFADEDGCADDAVLVSLRLFDERGRPVPGAQVRVVGPETRNIDPSGPVELHPGTYEMRAWADGYDPVERVLVVPPGFSFAAAVAIPERIGTLAVRAVGPDGRPVPATFSVSGSPMRPADGQALPLSVGEHAVVVSSPDYPAQAVSLLIERGDVREWTAVFGAPSAAPGMRPDGIGAVERDDSAVADASRSR